MMRSIDQILQEFEIDKERGFLPSLDPISCLDSYYEDWEIIAADFSVLINTQQLGHRLDQLKPLSTEYLTKKTDLERAMLLLSFFGHGYVFNPTRSTPRTTLPSGIAIPWTQVAKKLGRQAILSHASAVLHNWRKIDPAGPIDAYNIACLMQFHGGIDEAWFFLSTVEIEQRGAPAILAILEAHLALKQNNFSKAEQALDTLITSFESVLEGLKKTRDFCDPYIFYNRIRPFLASFTDVQYQGVEPLIQSYHGGSAAQSSLLQVFDAAFQIKHPNPGVHYFLTEMRKYMPPKHAAFIAFAEKEIDLPSSCQSHPQLLDRIKKCKALLLAFRNEHLKIVAEYIIKQSNDVGPGQTGTGGTNPLRFLKQVRDDI